MLDILKLRLRISGDDFNEEINELQDAGEADLKLAGIIDSKFTKTTDVYDDVLVKRAIIVYVKNNFGWDNPDFEKLEKSYQSLKMHMLLSDEYIGV